MLQDKGILVESERDRWKQQCATHVFQTNFSTLFCRCCVIIHVELNIYYVMKYLKNRTVERKRILTQNDSISWLLSTGN